MHANDPVLIIDDDALIITGVEPAVALRPYTRKQLLALCRKVYLNSGDAARSKDALRAVFYFHRRNLGKVKGKSRRS
jgi:hypothetical protein